MWRSGTLTRSKPVRKLHGLSSNEELLGWLYVGTPVGKHRSGRKRTVHAAKFLTEL